MAKKSVCFLHQNYPAQFGPISRFLLAHYDAEVHFLSQYVTKTVDPGVKHLAYAPAQTGHEQTPYFFSRYFEQETANMHGVWEAMRQAKLQPDLLVGHAAFGTLGLLHVTYPEAKRIGYFELFYDVEGALKDDRPEFPSPFPNRVRVPLRNATQLVELVGCHKGYSPTPYQRSTYPAEFLPKLAVRFDGIDTDFYRPGEVPADSELARTWPADAKVVTFVSRGLEAMRGVDVFMEVADRVCKARPDVHFVIAGRPRTHYGSDKLHIGNHETFKDYVLAQKPYELNRFHFLDWVSEPALRDLFRLSDCHVYWSTPFTLSWSLFQAMSTGVCVVASDTPAVRDIVLDGVTGRLVAPFDRDAFAQEILATLEHPKAYLPWRQAAREQMVAHYDFSVCLPRLASYLMDEG